MAQFYASSGGKSAKIGLHSFTMSRAEFAAFVSESDVYNLVRDERVVAKVTLAAQRMLPKADLTFLFLVVGLSASTARAPSAFPLWSAA